MKMTLARALKEKNRMVGELNRLYNLICRHNGFSFDVQFKPDAEIPDTISREEALKRADYDAKALCDEYLKLEERFIKLKIAINLANAGAAETLIRLAEAKSHLVKLDQINGGSNTVRKYEPGDGKPKSATYTIWAFTQKDLDDKRKRYTDLVNKYQDDIDEFNAKTSIEIADE